MRSTQSWALQPYTVGFVDDDGRGCIVALPGGSMINTEQMGDGDTPFYIYETVDDKLVKKEVFYPGWASW